VPVDEIGLGRYRARVPLSNHERLTLRLRDCDHDKLKVLQYHRPYPAEYRLSRTLRPALAQLESITPKTIRNDLTPERRRKSIAHYVYFGALACLLGSILMRRL
jgi:hypothetical protein